MSGQTLEVKIIGDPSSVKRAFSEVNDAGGKLHGFLTGAFKTGLAAAGGGLVALGGFAKIGFSEFMDASKVTAQTNAVIKSTGGAANVTADQVNKLATALLKKSGIDDEAIAVGREHAADVHEHPERGRQGERHLQPGDESHVDMSSRRGRT
jgi:hypothetical protein